MKSTNNAVNFSNSIIQEASTKKINNAEQPFGIERRNHIN